MLWFGSRRSPGTSWSASAKPLKGCETQFWSEEASVRERAWLGVTWELLETVKERCCSLGHSLRKALGAGNLGWRVEIPERFQPLSKNEILKVY